MRWRWRLAAAGSSAGCIPGSGIAAKIPAARGSPASRGPAPSKRNASRAGHEQSSRAGSVGARSPSEAGAEGDDSSWQQEEAGADAAGRAAGAARRQQQTPPGPNGTATRHAINTRNKLDDTASPPFRRSQYRSPGAPGQPEPAGEALRGGSEAGRTGRGVEAGAAAHLPEARGRDTGAALLEVRVDTAAEITVHPSVKPWLSACTVARLLRFALAGLPFTAALEPAALAAEPVIADNSFLVEEAYNQEAGVVQHIFGAQWSRFTEGDLAATFTQEWPLGGIRHQLSASIPYSAPESGAPNGLGDIVVNYRYQLGGDGTWAAAPRLSAILPTGDETDGLGSGAFGLQANLPFSAKVGPRVAAHANAGVTWLPGVSAPSAGDGDPPGEERDLLSPFLAASVVGPVDRRLQLLLEAVAVFPEDFDATGGTERTTETIVSPGLRAAFDAAGAQIVPGAAIPFTFAGGESDAGLFLYLSIEHRFSGSD